jgi:hypothetical protein
MLIGYSFQYGSGAVSGRGFSEVGEKLLEGSCSRLCAYEFPCLKGSEYGMVQRH